MAAQRFDPQMFLGSGLLDDAQAADDAAIQALLNGTELPEEDRSKLGEGVERIIAQFKAQDQDKQSLILPNSDNGQSGAGNSDDVTPATSPSTEVVTPTVTDKATVPASTIGSETDATNGLDSGAEGASSETTPTTFKIKLPSNGAEIEFTAAQFEGLVNLDQWAASLPPELRQAYADIEQGNAVAMPLDMAREFIEWKRSGSQPAPAQTAPTNQSNNFDQLLQFADPEIKEAFKAQQAAIEALQKQITPQPTSTPIAQTSPVEGQIFQHNPQVTAQQQEIQRRSQVAVSTLEAFQKEHNLSDAEMQTIADQIVRTNLPTEIYRQNTVVAPNGQIIREPAFEDVMASAVHYASHAIPSIAQKLTPAPVNEPQGQQVQATQPIATTPAQNNVVPIKKARSSSLAAAPSTNASTPQKAITEMDPDEITAEIAAFIRQETGG